MNILEIQNNQECLNFVKWFADAEPGSTYTYTSGLSFYEPKASVKKLAWEYAINGKVYIYQKKVTDEIYAYIAFKPRIGLRKLVPWDYWYENPRKTYNLKKPKMEKVR